MINHPPRRRAGAVLLAATVAATGSALGPASAAFAGLDPRAGGQIVQGAAAGGGAAASALAAVTYYVDPAGSDSASGTSPATAWKTLTKANGRAFASGDSVLFKRGATFTGAHLVAARTGVTYGAYGDANGARPILDGSFGASHTVDVSAPSVILQDLQVQRGGGTDKIGISVTAADVIVRRSTVTNNAIGVQAAQGADRLRVTGTVLRDNKTVIEPPEDTDNNDDYGASGVVVLTADRVQIDNNSFSGNYGPSEDFGIDGSAVELYGGTNTVVRNNIATDNHTFSELGNSNTNNTHFYNNIILTTAAAPDEAFGFNVQGRGRFGGVDNTIITNNTIVMLSTEAGPLSTGKDAGHVVFHSNIVRGVLYAGYTEDPIDEGHNVYYTPDPNAYNGIKSLNSADRNSPAPSSVTADPKFESGTYRPQAGSPAVNRNADTYGVTIDYAGSARKVGGAVDAGVYERQ